MLYSFLIALVLVVMYKTNSIQEYLGLIGLKLSDYESNKSKYGTSVNDYNIFMYLASKYPCFITRLLVCPICTGIWLGLGSLLFYSPAKYFGITFCGILMYLLFSIAKKIEEQL